MSKFVERSMTCGNCEQIFVGYGRGPNGEKRAYRQAMSLLKAHHCQPLFDSPDIPQVTEGTLATIIQALREKMPDVTFTRHKV